MSTFTNFKVHPINGQVTFQIHHIDLAFANTIRRVILSELPNVGVKFDPYDSSKSDIHFIENTSSLHNEFLGHRLSLLPIRVTEDEIDTYDSEKYKFVINVHNTSHEKLNVTSNDIKIYDQNGKEYGEDVHKKIFPVSSLTQDPILLVVLNPNHYNTEFGEKLHVEFRASIGIGSDHSRFSPVSTCTYFNLIDEEKAEQAKKFLIEKTEKSLSDKAGKKTVLDEDHKQKLIQRFEVHDKYRYFKTNQYDEADCFEFTLESECRMTPKYLMTKAFEVIQKKCESLLNEKRYKIMHLGSNMYFSILLKNENHTLGNLLQSFFYNIYVRDQNILDMIGYYLVHPLVDEIMIKLKFNESTEEKTIEDVDNLFKNGIQDLIHILDEMKDTWIKDYDQNMGINFSKEDTNKVKETKMKKGEKDTKVVKKQASSKSTTKVSKSVSKSTKEPKANKSS